MDGLKNAERNKARTKVENRVLNWCGIETNGNEISKMHLIFRTENLTLFA